jgi:hypothetical protein
VFWRWDGEIADSFAVLRGNFTSFCNNPQPIPIGRRYHQQMTMERPMTRQSIFFSVLAISLAVMSLSMAPKPLAPVSSLAIVAPASPQHSLTGVAFHSMSMGY